MAARNTTLTAAEVRKLFIYNPETGEIFWRGRKWRDQPANPIAGYVSKSTGYRYIAIDRKRYAAHRLAWLYVHGTMPSQIDHINRDPLDNRIENLRPTDPLANSQNQIGRGVSYRPKSGKWHARICVNRRQISIGFFDREAEARAAYLIAKWHLHPSFRASVCDSYATDMRQQVSPQTWDVVMSRIHYEKWSEREDLNLRPPQPH